jgi:hypothetical protein
MIIYIEFIGLDNIDGVGGPNFVRMSHDTSSDALIKKLNKRWCRIFSPKM